MCRNTDHVFYNNVFENFSFISSVVIYYLVFVLLMNLFVVLKRIFTVINEDINICSEKHGKGK